MSEELAVDVKDLRKVFDGFVAVEKVSLKVRKGEVFGFLGPNGSGKTTTIRMICGLLTPQGGSGTVLGYDVLRQSGEIQKRIGYMTQQFSLYTELTIKENLTFVARMYKMDDVKGRVEAALDDLGLQDRQNQLAGTLSGGWKQRLALAACMIHEPELLLLDEPTAGVDPRARREFWDEIHQLAEKGITVLVSTHYMDEAERCHRLAYLSRGELLAHGTGDELIADAGIHTWRIEGVDDTGLSDSLQASGAVETIAPFGRAFRVSGTDEDGLKQAVEKATKGRDLKIQEVKPSLEDVFIHLMNRYEDREREGEAA